MKNLHRRATEAAERLQKAVLSRLGRGGYFDTLSRTEGMSFRRGTRLPGILGGQKRLLRVLGVSAVNQIGFTEIR